jgi:hypothetical protein
VAVARPGCVAGDSRVPTARPNSSPGSWTDTMTPALFPLARGVAAPPLPPRSLLTQPRRSIVIP